MMSEISLQKHDEGITEWMLRDSDSERISPTNEKGNTVFLSNISTEENLSWAHRRSDW